MLGSLFKKGAKFKSYHLIYHFKLTVQMTDDCEINLKFVKKTWLENKREKELSTNVLEANHP